MIKYMLRQKAFKFYSTLSTRLVYLVDFTPENYHFVKTLGLKFRKSNTPHNPVHST